MWGECDVLTAAPKISVVEDCLYVPFDQAVFFDRDPKWGIYDTAGRLVDAAAYRRGANASLIGQSDQLQIVVDVADKASDAEYVYFGPVIPHYGHFLLSSLSRLWPLADGRLRDAKFLFHSDFDMEDHFNNAYVGPILKALGLAPENFVRFLHPTRVSRLIIPHAAIVEQKLAHTSFAQLCHQIGDVLTADLPRTTSQRPLYLSKSKVGAGGVSHVINEAEIETLLLERGVEICYPEQLPLAEQISIFQSRELVFGFAGSGFHTHIFSRTPPIIVGISMDPFVNSNLHLLDNINHVNGIYLYPSCNISEVSIQSFLKSRVIPDPKRFASDLVVAIEQVNPESQIEEEAVSQSSAVETAGAAPYGPHCLRDHSGENYRSLLTRLHAELRPKSYLEIGTLDGGTLKLSSCPSIAIDPKFQIRQDVIRSKSSCMFFQISSDDFFLSNDPKKLLGRSIDLAFLDGMHHCEFLLRDFCNTEKHCRPNSVIALHDCIPLEAPMTDRVQSGTPPIASHRGGWWTGDVWRTLLALLDHRPDLRILCLDAEPTGLVLVTNLDPASTLIETDYAAIVENMMSTDLTDLTVGAFLERINLKSTSVVGTPEKIASRFRL